MYGSRATSCDDWSSSSRWIAYERSPTVRCRHPSIQAGPTRVRAGPARRPASAGRARARRAAPRRAGRRRGAPPTRPRSASRRRGSRRRPRDGRGRCARRSRGTGRPRRRGGSGGRAAGRRRPSTGRASPFQSSTLDGAVVGARRPAVDERAGAVAGQLEPDAGRAPSSSASAQRPEARLAQVADRQQPEAAVDEPRRPAELLEVVGDAPSTRARRRGPATLFMPCSTNGAPQTTSRRGRSASGVAPHSVHQISHVVEPARAQRLADVERQVAVGVRREEVERRVARRATKSRKSATHPAAAVAGPPTQQPLVDRLHRARGDVVEPEVLVLRARSRRPRGSASFQTSKPQRATSSIP